jgi:hypothetical protein
MAPIALSDQRRPPAAATTVLLDATTSIGVPICTNVLHCAGATAERAVT